ncbi:MAG: riboflavin synthase [Planctomycetota bacterium]
MFSGIIDATGFIVASDVSDAGRRLMIRAPGYWADTIHGASVAIDGVCLTLTHTDGADAAFDVVAETLRRTTLGRLTPGDRVNLQKSLRVGDRIDGHFVQGHVDAIGVISRIDRDDGESMWWIELDDHAMRYLIPKGSVAIDGISLTVAKMAGGQFGVAIIPTTLEITTLGTKRVGASVNIETDILSRTVVQHLERVADAGHLIAGRS